jgi:hypothetical protein
LDFGSFCAGGLFAPIKAAIYFINLKNLISLYFHYLVKRVSSSSLLELDHQFPQVQVQVCLE